MLRHVSLTARDAPALAAFYRAALGLTLRRPARWLSGPRVGQGNGLPGCEILSIWLDFTPPGGPFLEILEYRGGPAAHPPRVDRPGFGHIALGVPDLEIACARIVAQGGRSQGEITDLGRPGAPARTLYMRDPEGNVIELEEITRP